MTLEDTIDIQAATDIVWAVTEDVERWPEWSPTMDAIVRVDDGPFQVGSLARIKQPGLPEATWTVTELTSGKTFTWETRVRRVYMIAAHELEATEGGTRSTLRIEMRGFVAALLGPLMRGSVGKALRQENEGLKTRCELASDTEDRIDL